ncbi:MAG: hypothetical protein Q9157_006102 [Trypethelium eluteriae]
MQVEGSREDDAIAPRCPQDNQARPIVACLRCRDQKLKCDRELPSCARCCRQKAICRYPSPPDRKRIAQKPSRSRASRSKGAEHVHRPGSPTAAGRPEKRQRIGNDNPACLDGTSTETEEAELPSTEVGLLLLEVYFKRLYNATLMLHKSVAFELYITNQIPAHLLRAIFAHAAVFLQQVDSPYAKYIRVFSLHTLYEKSWSWARSASQEVLSHADEPSITKIQALQILQFYYFSRGEIQRAIVHTSLAYRLSQLLGYDRLYEDDIVSSTNHGTQFDREIKRRCFWACWCSVSMGSARLGSSDVCEKVAGLPLPAKFESRGSRQGLQFKLGQTMEADWKLSTESLSDHETATGSSSSSLMAGLIKLLGIWTKVQAFISDSTMYSTAQRVDHLKKLIQLSDPIERSIHLPFTDLSSQAELFDETPELLTSVSSLYYLNRILMHASMVPILSGYPIEPPTSRELVQENAEMVLQHAIGFAGILQQFVERGLDMTRLWPFTGYGAFVVGSVFVAVKLDKAITAGQSSDADLITSPTYPWNTHPLTCSFEDPGPTGSVPNNSNPSGSLFRTPFVSLFSGDHPVQNESRYERSTEAYRTLSEPQACSQTVATTGTSASQAANSGNQQDEHASVEDSLTSSNEGGFFHAPWWDTAPAMNIWEHPSFLVETPQGGSMI